MGATGRGIGTGLAVGTDVAPAFPPAAGLSTASATRTLLPRRSCRAAAQIPFKPRESIPDGAQRFLVAHSCRASLARRRFAAQPVRREPSRRQTGKPAYSCLAESQKPKANRPASPPRQAVDARFRRKSGAVNTAHCSMKLREVRGCIRKNIGTDREQNERGDSIGMAIDPLPKTGVV